MGLEEFKNAELARRRRCLESLHWTEECLLRSRSCLEASHALFARNPATMTNVLGMHKPLTRPQTRLQDQLRAEI